MINLETPKKFEFLVSNAHQVATEIFRANSRKYDGDEHSYPKELDMLAAVIDGMNEGGALSGAGAGGVGESNGSKAPVNTGTEVLFSRSAIRIFNGWCADGFGGGRCEMT